MAPDRVVASAYRVLVCSDHAVREIFGSLLLSVGGSVSLCLNNLLALIPSVYVHVDGCERDGTGRNVWQYGSDLLQV